MITPLNLISMLSVFITFINIIYLLQLKKNWKLIILGIIISIISIIIPIHLKLLSTIILLFIALNIYYYLNDSFKNSQLILPAICLAYIISMITELIITLCITILNIPVKNSIFLIITNLIIIILSFIWIRTKQINNLWNALKSYNKKYNIVIFTIILTIINLYIISENNSYKFIILIISFILYFYYLISTLINERYTINEKYDRDKKNLEFYENLISSIKVSTHENKNQLLTIRNMVKMKDKNTIKYIDKIIGNEINDNEKLFHSINGIPFPGLTALIYSKLITCREKQINSQCTISYEIKQKNIINITDDTLLNINKIIGVFLDNAIEATEQTDNKHISIYIYQENHDIIIQISNTYSGPININLLEKKGYSTKGEGRGYGLTLVKDIKKMEANIDTKTRIEDDIFIQSLIIKNIIK